MLEHPELRSTGPSPPDLSQAAASLQWEEGVKEVILHMPLLPYLMGPVTVPGLSGKAQGTYITYSGVWYMS